MIDVCIGAVQRRDTQPGLGKQDEGECQRRECRSLSHFFQLHSLSLSITHLSKTFPMLGYTQGNQIHPLKQMSSNTHWWDREQIYEYSENSDQAEWNFMVF